jgi:hypothetical protein
MDPTDSDPIRNTAFNPCLLFVNTELLAFAGTLHHSEHLVLYLPRMSSLIAALLLYMPRTLC